MKEIQLTQNQIALVDDDMYEELNRHKWFAYKPWNTFYVHRNSPTINGKRHIIKMHHEIMGMPPKGYEVDHENGSGLDNQRHNLRFVTHRQNGQNLTHRNKTSQYPGVCWHKRYQKWRTTIQINGKHKHLGFFTNELEAFIVYEKAVEALGEIILSKQ